MVTVLLFFAVATVIAGSMAERSFLSVGRAERQLVYAQAWQYALAGEAYARQLLHTDFADAEPLETEDAPGRPGLLFKMVETFEQGVLDISVFDLQAGFNINNVVGGAEEDNERALRQISRLMENLPVEPGAIEALLRRLTVHAASESADAPDAGHVSRERVPDWRSANWLIAHLSELYSWEDTDRETIGKLAPYLSALPPPTAVNVNTAPPPVLQALAEGMSAVDAERIVDARGSKGFTDTDDFIKDESTAGLNMNSGDVTIKSRYFMVFVKSTFADQTLPLLTVFYRYPETNRIRMLSRTRSGDVAFDTPARTDNQSS